MAGRGPRFEYEIGEHVLCFEPDLTKARVLYDAKVVDQLMVKDATGKKKANYVVHFQGWNSSWDRQVGDHYVLRNTDENRELMRKLAETAKRLKNGPRRRKINTILHHAFGGSPPEFEYVSDSHGSDEESDSGKHKGKGKASQEKKRQLQKASACEFEIPESLKVHIEDDYFLINKKNKLTALPAKPCVIDILESFMKTFCVNYVCDPTGGREKTRNSNKHTLKSSPDKCVSLCKEFVDGLRVIFDFTLPIALLYAAEQQQYETAMAQARPVGEGCSSEKESSSGEPSTKVAKHSYSRSKWKSGINCKDQQPSSNHQKPSCRSPSPGPSESSSEPSPSTPPRRVTRQCVHDIPKAGSPSLKHKSAGSHRHSKTQQVASTSSYVFPAKMTEEGKQEPVIPIASRTRRRTLLDYDEASTSHVQVKQEPGLEMETEIFLPATSSVQYQSQTDQSVSNGQGSGHSVVGTESLTMSSCHGQEDAMERILGWQLMPPDVKMNQAVTPSQIYGIIHLLRMFVKLPDLLKKMKMKDGQLQIIIKFIHHCLQYLVNHQNELLHSQSYVKA